MKKKGRGEEKIKDKTKLRKTEEGERGRQNGTGRTAEEEERTRNNSRRRGGRRKTHRLSRRRMRKERG